VGLGACPILGGLAVPVALGSYLFLGAEAAAAASFDPGFLLDQE
jgi:hypothetical protein